MVDRKLIAEAFDKTVDLLAEKYFNFTHSSLFIIIAFTLLILHYIFKVI